MNELEILKSTGMSEADAKRHIKMGVVIYEVDDYLKHFDEYAESLEDDDQNRLYRFLTAKENGSHLWDNDLTVCDGAAYYIEYCL